MKKSEVSLPVVNPHAAGIDIGSKSHWVAVDQLHEHVREFGVYTKDHNLLVDYLHEHHITTVAMESTGNYWQTLFSALQKAGFKVILGKGANTKNISGKKTDILDCMWIQRLHELGLLPASFILSDYLQCLRVYFTHREYLIRQTSKYVTKMQKALRLMNIRLDVAINDVTGKTGRAIINAILEGNRDPNALASLADFRIRKSKAEIAEALHGEWREELLFELKSCLRFYDAYVAEIAVCDQQIENMLQQYKSADDTLSDLNNKPELKAGCKRGGKFAPAFNIKQFAFVQFNTDLFEIPGVGHSVVLSLLCNMGTDIKKFNSAKQFASWLRLVPNNKKSGGKVISSRTPKGGNTIANSLRQAANVIGNLKDHPLAPFFRRIAFKKGRAAAITATARKLAIIIWTMIARTEPYRGYDYEAINQRRKGSQIKSISKRISRLRLTDEEMKTLFERTSLLSAT